MVQIRYLLVQLLDHILRCRNEALVGSLPCPRVADGGQRSGDVTYFDVLGAAGIVLLQYLDGILLDFLLLLAILLLAQLLPDVIRAVKPDDDAGFAFGSHRRVEVVIQDPIVVFELRASDFVATCLHNLYVITGV